MQNIINKIFEFQSLIKDKVISDNTKISLFKKINYVCFGIFIIYGIFIINLEFNEYVKNFLFLIICIVNLISIFLSRMENMCSSIKEFLETSVFTTLILGIFIYWRLSKYIKDRYWLYVIIIITFTLIWSFLSTLSNPKVGTISNAIIAVVLGIALQANSFIWSIFELDKINLGFDISYVGLNFSEYEFIEISINTLLFPFFVMVTVGALACAYKEYWLEDR